MKVIIIIIIIFIPYYRVRTFVTGYALSLQGTHFRCRVRIFVAGYAGPLQGTQVRCRVRVAGYAFGWRQRGPGPDSLPPGCKGPQVAGVDSCDEQGGLYGRE